GGTRADRGDVMRADRLPGGERETLGLLDLAPLDQQLRESPLHLAQGRAILERLQDADRLAEVPLRSGDVAPAPDHPGEVVERAGERPGGSRLGEQDARLLERRLGIVQLALLQVQQAAEVERQSSRDNLTAL